MILATSDCKDIGNDWMGFDPRIRPLEVLDTWSIALQAEARL